MRAGHYVQLVYVCAVVVLVLCMGRVQVDDVLQFLLVTTRYFYFLFHPFLFPLPDHYIFVSRLNSFFGPCRCSRESAHTYTSLDQSKTHSTLTLFFALFGTHPTSLVSSNPSRRSPFRATSCMVRCTVSDVRQKRRFYRWV